MNYYEELGLPATATLAQIQQAHRSLASLLHPDKQRNQELKAVAERQMRRLNEVTAILKDPAQRVRYDLSLKPKVSPRISTPPTVAPEALSTRIVWCLCLFVGFGGIFSYLRDDLRHTRLIESQAQFGCLESGQLQARLQQLEQEVKLLRLRRSLPLENLK